MKRLFLYYLSLALTLGAPLYAQSVKELQKQQRALQEEMAQTNKMLQQTKKNETATLNKLQLLNRNIRTQRALITNLTNEINALDGERASIEKRCDSLNNRLDQLRADYARLVRESHYTQLQQSPLLFLLSADSFQQMARRIRYLQEFSEYRRTQAEQIREVQAELQTQNDMLAQIREDKRASLNGQKRQQEQLARDERKQKQMLSELKKKKKTLTAQQQKQQKKVDELNRKIDDIIRRQANPQTTLTKEQQLISGGFEQNRGRLPWPVEKGFISGHFGKHQHPVYEHVTIDNKGIYIQTTAGAKARAVYEGEVTSCFVTGNTYAVIVQHGNYRSVYSGLSRLSVKQGDKLKTKQAIGTIFADPEQDNKTELYFQIYKGRDIQNPSLWLAQ